MIPQLWQTISKPSPLLLTQLLRSVDGGHLAEVLGSPRRCT